jgi:iron complex transport system ATP-binding protein
MRLIRDLAQSHAVIVSCHDINLAARFATHALVLGPERHWIGRAGDVLTTDVLQHAFGCRFDVIQLDSGRNFIAY